jgi:hypothetical protein
MLEECLSFSSSFSSSIQQRLESVAVLSARKFPDENLLPIIIICGVVVE